MIHCKNYEQQAKIYLRFYTQIECDIFNRWARANSIVYNGRLDEPLVSARIINDIFYTPAIGWMWGQAPRIIEIPVLQFLSPYINS